MPCTGSLAIALVVVVLIANSVTADTPATGPAIVRAEASPSLSARVLSVGPFVHKVRVRQAKDGVATASPGEPAVTGGSGIVRYGGWTIVAQDDSSDFAAIADDGRVARLRLFDPVDGRDRFHPSFGNKNRKPDIEAIVRVRASANLVRRLGGNPGHARTSPVFLLFGSGSIRGVRDRVAIVVPSKTLTTSLVRVATATGLYDRLRATPQVTGANGQLNLEAAAAIDGGRAVRLYNRGNSGAGSITASVDIPTRELLDDLSSAIDASNGESAARFGNFKVYDIGSSGGFAISIGEAIALPKNAAFGGSGAILIAGIAEAATNAVDDGATSGTVIGLHLERDRRLLITPVMQDGKPSSLKIEGLAVQSIRSVGGRGSRRIVMRVLGVVDADHPDPSEPSQRVELEVTFVPTGTPSGKRPTDGA